MPSRQLASFLTPATSLPASAGRAAFVGRPSLADTFVMQPQACTNWCWAAVAASVSSYFARFTPIPELQQCQVAGACLTGIPGPFCPPRPQIDWQPNRQALLEDALSAVRHNGGGPFRVPGSPAATYSLVRQQIVGLGLPVCCHLDLGPTESGHFVAIVDCIDAGGQVIVRDPARPPGPNFTGPHPVAELMRLGWDAYYFTAINRP